MRTVARHSIPIADGQLHREDSSNDKSLCPCQPRVLKLRWLPLVLVTHRPIR